MFIYEQILGIIIKNFKNIKFEFFLVSVGYIVNLYTKGIWVLFWVYVGYDLDTQMIPPLIPK